MASLVKFSIFSIYFICDYKSTIAEGHWFTGVVTEEHSMQERKRFILFNKALFYPNWNIMMHAIFYSRNSIYALWIEGFNFVPSIFNVLIQQ